MLNLSGWRERGFYGRGYRVKERITVDDLRRRLSTTLEHEVEILEDQFARNKVQVMRGFARFVDPHTFEVDCVDGETVRVGAGRIVLAVGTTPYRPPDIPFDDAILDADGILNMPRLPRSMTVIGAGVIGIEYATIFSALDVKVTVLDAADTLLQFVDRELVDEFLHDLRDRGVTVRLGAVPKSVERKGPDACLVQLEDGRQVWSEMILYAAGRQGAVDALGLEAAGLTADKRGRIKVDPTTLRTDVPHIFACGDVIGFPSLASTSMEQGRIAARAAFDEPIGNPSEFFPYGIYAVPEISTVGETEEEVRKRGEPYGSGVARFRETSRGHIMGVQGGFMKLIFSLRTRRLLGAHIMGEGATELIHIGQAVLNLGGTLEYFVDNPFNYPTLAEAYKIAALDAWNRMPRIM